MTIFILKKNCFWKSALETKNSKEQTLNFFNADRMSQVEINFAALLQVAIFESARAVDESGPRNVPYY